MTIIREEMPADIPVIDGLLRACFDGPDEATLVASLRAEGDLSLSLVAEKDGVIIGHVAFSPLLLRDHPQTRYVALAPLAVAEQHRRDGLGARLAETGLARLQKTGSDGAIVLGNPDYYGRFGFRAELAEGLLCDWSGRYLQALQFNAGAPKPTGDLVYAKSFQALV